MIEHSRTILTESDIAAAIGVLRTGQINESGVTRNLETLLKDQLGRKYAWATANGTAALYLSLLTLGIKQGDEVIIPTYVCDDVLSAVLQVGAIPIPIDLDPLDLNPCPNYARHKISVRTRAIIVAHVLGRPARMSEFLTLGVPVIEDCAHGLGGAINQALTGSIGHATTLSFHALKMITGGEGGMVLTDDFEMAKRYERLCSPNYSAREWKLRSRLPNVIAALCINQLERFPATVDRRREIANFYQLNSREWQRAVPLPIDSEDGRKSSSYRFSVVTDGSLPHDEIVRKFASQDIVVRRPVKNLCHRALGLPNKEYPAAESMFDRIVSLPLYPNLTDTEIRHVISVASEIFG
jgi:perosamine synthetase